MIALASDFGREALFHVALWIAFAAVSYRLGAALGYARGFHDAGRSEDGPIRLHEDLSGRPEGTRRKAGEHWTRGHRPT